ncbi:helix-turn-helix transcriptional regulator [Haloechinothrix sp. YIM 98757]|uniref:Helix-turn-helix transcriptional regulator n=1 Tax=Haloechinothrix aidingensis TaxID=2752311 RepID=A0A838A9Z5_9PSEU|nr:helix-turn-helix transcriptional regulator [Haloechinothrix aidingensis]MBA0126147.1 helix-turn-helix transcriptional regulator [Haloechinothrix aidingensis]
MTVLLREAIGDRLRHARTNQHRSLREISHSARVSLGYLSEVERGQKEASSELLAAICTALDLPLADLLHTVASDVSVLDSMAIDGAEIESAEMDGAETGRAHAEEHGARGGDGTDFSLSAGAQGPALRSTIHGSGVAPVVV